MRSKRFGWMLAEWCVAWALIAGGGTCRGGSPAMAWAQSGSTPAIATTTVTDTVYTASGSPAAGTVLISWPAFVTSGGANIPAGQTSVTLASNGLLSVALVPNSGSTPMGSYYTVVYHLADGTVTHQYWVVPALPVGGAASVKVSAISASVLPASVAMQTVSKSYVDQAIAAATTGTPLDGSPYVQKAGDTMTGPLVLPGDPVAPLQAAEKQYVDEQIASVGGGVGQKVSELPQATQVVVQPPGTDLAVNNLNGALYASQYVSGGGNNGIANAVASTDCASGCDVIAEHSYGSTERVAAASLNSQTRVEDRRNGRVVSSTLNPLNTVVTGDNSANAMDLASTRSAASLFALNGADEQFATTLKLTNEALAGGANVFPQNVQGVTPYFKTTYSALSTNGTSNTPGQHVLKPSLQICYSVGDCLMGSDFMVTSGGLRDDADEGSHPYDLNYTEDTQVFTGTCTSGCTAGSTLVNITPSAFGGTQGEGRYLLVTTPSKVISTGTLIGGSAGPLQQVASFSGTNFPVSTYLETAQAIPAQANNIAPGTVTVAIVTSAAPAGYAASTAALPAQSGVACVAGQASQLNSIVDFETAPYSVVDGGHLQLTLTRPHQIGATIAVGGLCGYGLEQKVDTTAGIRQVFPVIGSPSATTLNYAAGSTTIVGQSSTSGFVNLSQVIAAIARTGNVVTVTTAGNMAQDFSGLPLTIQGVADVSYNGTYTVTATSGNTLTYAQTGADSTSSGGTVSYVTGGFALYPMAEVVNVFNASTKAIDGQMTLAANTVNWAAGDTVEQPHYFQQKVSSDTQIVTQFTPRPALLQSAGIHFQGNNGFGLVGWEIANETATSAYFGAGGTHQLPNAGIAVYGPWQTSLDLEAGTSAVLAVRCNLHGCGRWNSTYNLAQMQSNQGVDAISYAPQTSALTFLLAGSSYAFTPQSFTAHAINVTQLNAGTISGLFTGSISASSLPVFGASGATHSVGAVPDPGAVAGTSRFLREDGTWIAPAGAAGSYLAATAIVEINQPPYAARCDGSTDDSATINAALASGASQVVFPPGGVTCAVANPLYVPSGMHVLLNGATVVDTSANGRVFTNTNAAASAAQTQANCAVTAGSTTLTCTGGNLTALTLPASVTVTNGNSGCSAYNAGTGQCTGLGTINLLTWITSVQSATTATMYQAAGNTVSGTTAAFYNRDHDIEITGGTIARAVGSDGEFSALIGLQNVDRAFVHDLYFTGNATAFNVFAQQATYVDCERLRFNRTGNNSDGCHFSGPLVHGVIHDLGGATCDNMAAITGQDTPGVGVVDDVTIDKISGTACGTGLVIASGAIGSLMNNITISNVEAMETNGYPALVAGFTSATVRNLQVSPAVSADTVGTLWVQGSQTANGVLLAENTKLTFSPVSGYTGSTSYQTVTLQNTAITPINNTTHLINGGTSGTPTINTLVLNNLLCTSQANAGCSLISIPSNVTIGSLVARGISSVNANSTNSDFFLLSGGTIGSLDVQYTASGFGFGDLFSFLSGSTTGAVKLDATVRATTAQGSNKGLLNIANGASVGAIEIPHLHMEYMGGLTGDLPTSGSNPAVMGTISLANAYFLHPNRAFGEFDQAATLLLNNVQIVSPINEALLSCSTATVTVLGTNVTVSGNASSFSNCGSSTYKARVNVGGGFPVNLGVSSLAASLVPVVGDVLYDTNAGALKSWNGATWIQVGGPILQEVLTTPASSSASCIAGQFWDDANYHYVCVATNTIKRSALTSF